MGTSLAKKSRERDVITKMPATQQATPPRKGSTQSKIQSQPHNKQAGFGTHPEGPPEISITEQLDIGGRSVPRLDSGYQSPGAGFEGICYDRLEPSSSPRNTDQVHSATTLEDSNLSGFQAFPANSEQGLVQESTNHFFEEGHVGDPFENLDFGGTGFEFNSQHNGYSGHSEFDFASLDLFLQSRKRAHDSDIESQNVESTLPNDGKSRSSPFDFESRDQFFPIKNMANVLSTTPEISIPLLRFLKMKEVSYAVLQISQMLIYLRRMKRMSLPSMIG